MAAVDDRIRKQSTTSNFRASRLKTEDLQNKSKLSSNFGRIYFGGKVDPKVRVIDIGPDPPGLFRKYIWGRSSKCIKIEEYKFSCTAKDMLTSILNLSFMC